MSQSRASLGILPDDPYIEPEPWPRITFDIVFLHNFSRFVRELEFYVRMLAKNGVKLVSITQEMGGDPMHVSSLLKWRKG